MRTAGAHRLVHLHRSPLLWLLVAAAVLRVAFHLQVRGEPTFIVPLWDEAVFDDMARSLADGHGSGLDKAYFFGPLYGYALGLVYAVTGAGAAAMVLLQHGLGLVLGGLTYALARRWFGRGESLLACGLLVTSGLQVFFEGKLLMEVLVSTLLAASLLLTCRADAPTRPWRLAVAGFLLGLAGTGRPTLLLLSPLVLVPLWRAPAGSRRRLAVALGLYVAGLAVAPGATFVRNLVVEGAPVLITSSGGYNFFAGNAGEAAGREQLRFDGSWNAENSVEAALGRDLDSAELSRYWTERALADIRRDPAIWARGYLRGLGLYLSGADVPQIEWFTWERARWPVLKYATIDQYALMALAMAGLLAMWPRRRDLACLYGVVAVTAVGVALFLVTTRYRVMLLPYLCIFAAAFVMALVRAARGRTWRTLGLLGCAAVAAAVITSPSLYPQDRRLATYGQYLHEGLQLTRAELPARAVAAYTRARDLWPEDYEGHLGLGRACRAAGDLRGSLASLQAARDCPHQDPEVEYQIGVTLHALNRFAEAERAVNASLALDPRRGARHAYLGLIHAAQGRYAEARGEIERGLALDRDQPEAWNNLGAILGLQEDVDGARRCFRSALEVDSSFAPARLNLARSLLESGHTAEAARELRLVPAGSPQQAEAAELLRTIGGRGER